MIVDELFKKVREEANGDLNRYYASLELGRSPSSVEALEYFLDHGGVENIEAKLRQKLEGKHDDQLSNVPQHVPPTMD